MPFLGSKLLLDTGVSCRATVREKCLMNNRLNIIRIFLLSWFLAAFLPLTSLASAQQVFELKPNLQALPAGDLAIVRDLSGGVKLLFSATTWNNGDGPLTLVAGETDSTTLKQNVYQRVYLSDGTFHHRLAGAFEWHPLHNHFHFDDYALYTLQPFDAPGGSERTSAKTSFCVMDTTKVNARLLGAPKRPVYVTCGNAMQGMSVGWGDKYGSQLAGQSIDLTGLADGDYKLIIEADPKKHLLEINDSDNASCVLLRISLTNLTLNVLDSNGCSGPGGGTIAVSSIAPNSASQDSIVPVTITGSGFTAGMGVSFENGSGTRPIASNVTVHDGNTISAIVTIKSSGSRNARTWDVRVGSAVLVDGFTVLP
jgi:hypothetical protein